MKRELLSISFIVASFLCKATIINVPANYPTIQAAILATANGDTVLVAPGTYFENLNFRGHKIVLTSLYYLNKDTSFIKSTIINGSQPSNPDTASCVIINSGEDSTTVLQGFTLTGGGGDFLILAQMPEPQPVWAQQYNAQMEPVWARAFEPPSVTGNESVGALEILMKLYVETGEEKFLKPSVAAFAWFKRSEVAPGIWARYYELHTNKQLFGDRDGKIYHRLQDISEERQRGYSWQGDYHVPRMLASYEKLQRKGRAGLLKERAAKPTKKKAPPSSSLEARVREIIASLDAQGRWVIKGHAKKRDWEFNDRVDADLFVKNVAALCDYLEAAK